MYNEILFTIYMGLVFVVGVLAFMNLDLQEKNEALKEELSEIERIKKLAMNKRTVLSAKSDFESQLQTGVQGLAIWIFVSIIIILIGTEISKNNYRYNEINRKIKENREINAYLLSQIELIKEYLNIEEKEYVVKN